MQAMAQRKLRFRMGPNPQDQNEEREARVTAILERVQQHRDKIVIPQRIESTCDKPRVSARMTVRTLCPRIPIARVG